MRAICRVIERDNQSKGSVTTGRGREKSGESEENRERDVEGDTCHVCIEREKKSLQLSIQLNVAVRHCSCCCYLCWLEKKNVFMYFNNSRVHRERKNFFCPIPN